MLRSICLNVCIMTDQPKDMAVAPALVAGQVAAVGFMTPPVGLSRVELATRSMLIRDTGGRFPAKMDIDEARVVMPCGWLE